MNKKEFLDILYGQLIDQMPSDRASAHVRYYQTYIEEEAQKGRREDEIFQTLGDPRLIAKTLIDTESEPGFHTQPSGEAYSSDGSDTAHPKSHSYKLNLSTWYGKLIVILAAAAVLVLLFMALSFLLPFVLVGSLILFFISWFRKRR